MEGWGGRVEVDRCGCQGLILGGGGRGLGEDRGDQEGATRGYEYTCSFTTPVVRLSSRLITTNYRPLHYTSSSSFFFSQSDYS